MSVLSVRVVGGSTWTELPSPDFNGGMVVGIQDIDSSSAGRDSTGLMHRDRVATKIKISCTWSNRKISEIRTILDSAIKNVFFELQYYDPLTGSTTSGTFYCGDASTSHYTADIGTLQRNFIER